MKKDLLRLIKAQRDVTNAVVLTHNIDFVVLQNLLLPALRRCGSPNLTVFADAHSAAETFSLQAPLLSNLGRRYRVVPVAMTPGFCFHPKAVLLSGRDRALLLVGSGNLTFGGWRDNAEIWAAYDSTEGTSEIAAFRRYLSDLVARLALNRNLRTEIDEAFDPQTRPWALNLDAPAGLIGRLGTGEPLLARIRREIGTKNVGRLLVSTPYFDEDGEALQKLVSALGTPETRVVVDAEHTNLPPDFASNPPAGVRFRPGTVPASSPAAGRRRRFLHAKLYVLERGDDVTLLLGSANCSRAALTLGGENGNAELMAVRRLSAEELQSEILDEMEIGPEPLELPAATATDDEDHEDEDETAASRPRLLAARQQDGLLQIAYIAPPRWRPEAAWVDGASRPLQLTRPGRCECPASREARTAWLRGRLDGETLDTAPLWIDHEAHLASSAYRRSLGTTTRGKSWQSDGDVGDWADVLGAHDGAVAVFTSDLELDPVYYSDDNGLEEYLSQLFIFSDGFESGDTSAWSSVVGIHFSQLVTVNPPSTIEGSYVANPSNSGGTANGLTADLAIVEDGVPPTADGCESITKDLADKIALIVWNQGACNSSVFVANAAGAGAVAAIIVDNNDLPTTDFGGSVLIPSVAVGLLDGQIFITTINGGETINATLEDNPEVEISPRVIRH